MRCFEARPWRDPVRTIEPMLAAHADELRRCAAGTPAVIIGVFARTRTDRRPRARVDRAPFWDEPDHGTKKIACIDRVLDTVSLPELPWMLGGVSVRFSLSGGTAPADRVVPDGARLDN
jgi:hypothetical protein